MLGKCFEFFQLSENCLPVVSKMFSYSNLFHHFHYLILFQLSNSQKHQFYFHIKLWRSFDKLSFHKLFLKSEICMDGRTDVHSDLVTSWAAVTARKGKINSPKCSSPQNSAGGAKRQPVFLRSVVVWCVVLLQLSNLSSAAHVIDLGSEASNSIPDNYKPKQTWLRCEKPGFNISFTLILNYVWH
jgi:hypothetical protein